MMAIIIIRSLINNNAVPSGRALKGVGLRPFASWECEFESRQRRGYLSLVNGCAMSCRGLYDELITRPEKSYRLWCAVMCAVETSRILLA